MQRLPKWKARSSGVSRKYTVETTTTHHLWRLNDESVGQPSDTEAEELHGQSKQ